MARKAKIVRKTTETDIALDIDLDKSAASRIDTTIPFLNHMLELFARHGQFKLVVKSKGDTEIDDHHLVEDLGICLGQAVGQALGHNPFAPIVPCHRVLAAANASGGFSAGGGVSTKLKMLEIEKARFGPQAGLFDG